MQDCQKEYSEAPVQPDQKGGGRLHLKKELELQVREERREAAGRTKSTVQEEVGAG